MIPRSVVCQAIMQIIQNMPWSHCERIKHPFTEVEYKAGTLYARLGRNNNLRNIDKWKKRNER